MSSLPAGAFLTTFNGKQCTASPLSTSTSSSTTTATSSTIFSTTSSSDVQSTSTAVQASPAVEGGSSTIEISTTSFQSSTSVIIASSAVVTSTSTAAQDTAAIVETSSTSTATTLAPSSSDTTTIASDSTTTASDTTTVASSSETSTTRSTTEDTSHSQFTHTQSVFSTAASAANFAASTSASTTSVAATTSDSKSVDPGPMVGGVLGGLAFLGLVGFLLWWLLRRKKSKRESLLTPLTPEPSTGTRTQFYEIDQSTLGPTPRHKVWKANAGAQLGQLRLNLKDYGSNLRAKVKGEKGGVNLDRGNSQFFESPMHSRNNSTASSAMAPKLTLKERFAELFVTRKGGMWRPLAKKEKGRPDTNPFLTVRTMSEKQAYSDAVPDFNQLLRMDEDEAARPSQRRSRSSGRPISRSLGSLGLDFNSNENPFADPINAHVSSSGQGAGQNPFADPVSLTQPKPAVVSKFAPRDQDTNYLSNVQRARGTSIATSGPPRFQSTIMPESSRQSYRDTMFSSSTLGTRKLQGRSDPFDLERPDLFPARSRRSSVPLQTNPELSQYLSGASGALGAGGQDELDRMLRRLEGRSDSRVLSGASSSLYTSDVPVSEDRYGSDRGLDNISMDGLGEPGPDLSRGYGPPPLAGNYLNVNQNSAGRVMSGRSGDIQIGMRGSSLRSDPGYEGLDYDGYGRRVTKNWDQESRSDISYGKAL